MPKIPNYSKVESNSTYQQWEHDKEDVQVEYVGKPVPGRGKEWQTLVMVRGKKVLQTNHAARDPADNEVKEWMRNHPNP